MSDLVRRHGGGEPSSGDRPVRALGGAAPRGRRHPAVRCPGAARTGAARSRPRTRSNACSSRWTCATSRSTDARRAPARHHREPVWSVLHETNIAHDGEWIECRLLASGERTNPWFQEILQPGVEAGDIVAFDTDMVGPCGYLADISRSLRGAPARGRPQSSASSTSSPRNRCCSISTCCVRG